MEDHEVKSEVGAAIVAVSAPIAQSGQPEKESTTMEATTAVTATKPRAPKINGATRVAKPAVKAKPAAKKVSATAQAKAAAKAKPAAKSAKKPVVKAVGINSTDALRVAAQSYVRDTERKTAGGNPSVDSGDKIAIRLRGKTLDEVYKEAAEALGETQKELKAKYAHLNIGMQRMSLGNRIRAAGKK
jgi:hypothetical protein